MPEPLKNWFNPARFAAIGDLLAELQPGFDRREFVHRATTGLEPLSILGRMRQGTLALRATLPPPYREALAVLHRLAPRIDHPFVGIMLPDFVGQFGRDHFDESMAALHHLTRFSSGELAIREFLRRDLPRTLAVMEGWSRDENEHVRRLASEGCRPRLPWSFQLPALIADPSPVAPILETLRADPSLYVRKSVANHLNDISKDHPAWMLARLRAWDLTHPPTAWIAKRAARTLLKAGDAGALALFNFTGRARVKLDAFKLTPRRVKLGQRIEFNFTIRSLATRSQRLAIDYLVHYVKARGGTAPKVFKLRELTLEPRTKVALTKSQVIRDFTTRRHHPGRHRVEIQINGEICGGGDFVLGRAG